MSGYVLDSYAVIAYLEDEKGAGKVERILNEAESEDTDLLMSVVNWGEAYYAIFRSKGEKRAEDALLYMEQLPIRIVELDRDSMYRVARIKASHAIALGDCFAAALAAETNYPLLTGDREFQKLATMVRVEWI